MKIIRVNENNFGKWKGRKKMDGEDFKEFKKWMLGKYAPKLSGRIWCKSLEKNIYVNKKSLEHGINSKGTIDKTKSLSVLDKLINTGLIKEEKEDYKDKSKTVIVLTNFLRIGKVLYNVEMIIKEDKNGRLYYHHDLLKTGKVS